jgi:hypothetical protein
MSCWELYDEAAFGPHARARLFSTSVSVVLSPLPRARNYSSIEQPGTTKSEMINAVEQHVEDPGALPASSVSNSLSGGPDA